ncbi:MAG: Holliday junction branch migration protein RuvA [bacterium]
MIAHLEGQIAEKTPTRVVLDVQGVGYELLVPISTFELLKEVGERAKLLTYQHVREDTLLLFGFATQKEKWMFRKLISVSGIGPKLALGVLSGCPLDQLVRFIVNGEIDRLSKLPGIGKKTAQRLSLELRDKLGELEPGREPAAGVSKGDLPRLEEAVLALVSLGVSRAEAERSVSKNLAEQADLPLDELIRRALQKS